MSYYQEDDTGRKVKVYDYNFKDGKVITKEVGNGVFIGWDVYFKFATIVMDDNGRVREVQAKHIQFIEKKNQKGNK